MEMDILGSFKHNTLHQFFFVNKVVNKLQFQRHKINYFTCQNLVKGSSIKPENLEMSGTGSSAHSIFSANSLSTDINSEDLRRFQQKFNHFNHKTERPHQFETNLVSGQNWLFVIQTKM